jgi:RES domain-containing protein
MTIYRMHRSARAAGDYAGAMLAGGRWNPIGTPMLYTAEHLSLACLEILVHIDKTQIPLDYVWSKAQLANQPGLLHFTDLNNVSSCQMAGDAWVRTADQLAIRVPSVVIPEEFNVLLNPNHSEFKALEWSDPRPFRFDPRLFVIEPHPV